MFNKRPITGLNSIWAGLPFHSTLKKILNKIIQANRLSISAEMTLVVHGTSEKGQLHDIGDTDIMSGSQYLAIFYNIQTSKNINSGNLN